MEQLDSAAPAACDTPSLFDLGRVSMTATVDYRAKEHLPAQLCMRTVFMPKYCLRPTAMAYGVIFLLRMPSRISWHSSQVKKAE